MRRLHRRALITAAVADAAGGAESAPEIDLARLCRRAGLPEPSRQVVRRDALGRKRYRDVYFDEWGVQAEVDGGQHMDVRAWYADMRQHNEIIIAGECLLRFPTWMLRHRPDEVVAQLRAALIAAGWHP
jgi:very-short-patch-repair endonuclease